MTNTTIIWIVVGVLVVILLALVTFAVIYVRKSRSKTRALDTQRFLAATSSSNKDMQDLYSRVHAFGQQKLPLNASGVPKDSDLLREHLEGIVGSYWNAHGNQFDPQVYSKHLANFRQHLPDSHYKVLESLQHVLG